MWSFQILAKVRDIQRSGIYRLENQLAFYEIVHKIPLVACQYLRAIIWRPSSPPLWFLFEESINLIFPYGDWMSIGMQIIAGQKENSQGQPSDCDDFWQANASSLQGERWRKNGYNNDLGSNLFCLWGKFIAIHFYFIFIFLETIAWERYTARMIGNVSYLRVCGFNLMNYWNEREFLWYCTFERFKLVKD